MRPPTDPAMIRRFTQRILCGGSWFEEPGEFGHGCQPSRRSYNTSAYSTRFLGFRCVSKTRTPRKPS